MLGLLYRICDQKLGIESLIILLFHLNSLLLLDILPVQPFQMTVQ